MSEFNRMTIVAAAEIISDVKSHSDMDVLDVEWGISGQFDTSSKSARAAGMARIAIDDDIEVQTEAGRTSLARAMVEAAIKAPPHKKAPATWNKLIAGLRFDGFEIMETEYEVGSENIFGSRAKEISVTLVRMLPSDIPGLDFRESESEVVSLLGRHGFTVAKGHLHRALSAFQRGEWSSANGELRNFYESYLNEIADRLGYSGQDNSKAKRDFLGCGVEPPFLLSYYNEWDSQKTQYIQALMNRLHPHGGHPGLSEEEDATFRLQIILVTARLLLRRFDQRGV